MGLFDFLRKPEQKTVTRGEPKEKYLGDLTKTDLIYKLVGTPKENRNENWTKQFLSAIPEASFRGTNPQIVTGPDGFPYFQLLLPEPGVGFQCFVIDKMKDDFLLENGFGVVINPTSTNADWVLSYGDILNYHLNKTFYSSDSLFSNETKDEVIKEKEEVMIGQPSETILPKMTRNILRTFLERNGVESPKILLMMRRNGETVTQDLVFNIVPENFENVNTHRTVMHTLAWYLPRHYSFVGVDEKTFEKSFMPL